MALNERVQSGTVNDSDQRLLQLHLKWKKKAPEVHRCLAVPCLVFMMIKLTTLKAQATQVTWPAVNLLE